MTRSRKNPRSAIYRADIMYFINARSFISVLDDMKYGMEYLRIIASIMPVYSEIFLTMIPKSRYRAPPLIFLHISRHIASDSANASDAPMILICSVSSL